MATQSWTGNTSTSFTASGNWTSAVPLDGDTIYFSDASTNACTADCAGQGAKNFAAIYVTESYATADVGTAAAPLTCTADYISMRGGGTLFLKGSRGSSLLNGSGASINGTATVTLPAGDYSSVAFANPVTGSGYILELDLVGEGVDGTDVHDILSVDDGSNTVDVSPAPSSTSGPHDWAIYNDFIDKVFVYSGRVVLDALVANSANRAVGLVSAFDGTTNLSDGKFITLDQHARGRGINLQVIVDSAVDQLTTVSQSAGVLLLSASVTTLNMDGGRCELKSAANLTTLNMRRHSRFQFNSSGTITTVDQTDGQWTYRFNETSGGGTVTTATVQRGVFDTGNGRGTLTMTNPVNIDGQGVRIIADVDKAVAIANQ